MSWIEGSWRGAVDAGSCRSGGSSSSGVYRGPTTDGSGVFESESTKAKD